MKNRCLDHTQCGCLVCSVLVPVAVPPDYSSMSSISDENYVGQILGHHHPLLVDSGFYVDEESAVAFDGSSSECSGDSVENTGLVLLRNRCIECNGVVAAFEMKTLNVIVHAWKPEREMYFSKQETSK